VLKRQLYGIVDQLLHALAPGIAPPLDRLLYGIFDLLLKVLAAGVAAAGIDLLLERLPYGIVDLLLERLLLLDVLAPGAGASVVLTAIGASVVLALPFWFPSFCDCCWVWACC
jgi:hypothetical protein